MSEDNPTPADSKPTAAGTDSDLLIGTTLGGRYVMTGRLGSGGAGHVYLAVQEPLGREVAIKVLRSDLRPLAQKEFSARFLREAEAVAGMRHPNVVAVHDFGVHEGLQYVVMERLRGERLSDRIARGPMPPAEVAAIGAGIARGLRHAHGRGLVHRDVKPSNVILEPGDDGERPVLLDFGLVKPTDEEGDEALTAVGTYMGTPAYMAPEQARGDGQVDARTDIYALGCVMFKMLTGVPPFAGKNALALALAHSSEAVPTFHDRNPELDLDPLLEVIVLRCLQKRPADRWPDAAALADALEGWRDAGPVKAAPAKRGGTGWVWGVALLGLGALGVGGLALATGLYLSVSAGEPAPEDITFATPDDPEPTPEDLEPEPQPEPQPEPEPQPGPAATPVAPQPSPAPVAPRPKPAPAPAPATAPITLDGHTFEPAHADRALKWLNTADAATLQAGGVLTQQRNIILAKRPFASLKAFADTPQIGEVAVRSVHRATLEP